MKQFIITKEYEGISIIRYLKEVRGFSGRTIRKAKVFVNNKKVKNFDKPLHEHETLCIEERHKRTGIEPAAMDLDVLYEDKELLVINKSPHLVVHPHAKNRGVTLANGIVYYFEKKGINAVPRFFNRLDMNTSGIIVVAKSAYAQGFLQEKGDVKKFYLAIAAGIVTDTVFTINKKIGISPGNIRRMIDIEDGKEAVTKVRLVDVNPEKNISLLELEILTGRTHQIRVHLASLGHPVLGDTLYGKSLPGVDRQLLHSYKLNFINPLSKQRQEITAGLPGDMKGYFENIDSV